jgi:tetratricopeptide (TPR) repeat protein
MSVRLSINFVVAEVTRLILFRRCFSRREVRASSRRLLQCAKPVILPVFCLATVCLAPQMAHAHGEAEILIREKTRQIEAATNNPALLYLQRAELHREHQDWDAAAIDYYRAAQSNPQLPNLEFCRARMLFEAGKLPGALAEFNKVLAREPSHGEALFGRARVLLQSGENQRSLLEFRQSLQLLSHPEPDHFLEVAQNFLSQGKTNDALEVLDDGMKKFGPLVSLQEPAVNVEVTRKNYESALKRVESIIRQVQRTENWLALRGDILLMAGHLNEAKEAFEQSLAAISTLPVRLQQGPPMMKLRSRLQTTLTGMVSTAEKQAD